MVNDILTPMNHREIEYNAKRLSGCNIPDSFACPAAQISHADINQVPECDSVITNPAQKENCASADAVQQESERRRLLADRDALLNWLDETGARVFDDDLVMDYGTDCLRLYLLFERTPRENDAPYYDSWQEGALEGIYKFLGRYRRMILAADAWNRLGGYEEETFSAEHVRRLRAALQTADAKIRKCILRGNTMTNRHNIVSALMELLNVFQTELKTGDIVSAFHSQAIEKAAPHSGFKSGADMKLESQNIGNPNVAVLCKDFILLMAPYAPDLSKILWSAIEKE